MAQYKILKRVSIGTDIRAREVGEVIDETEFSPAPVLNEAEIADGRVALTEVESLLASGHIELN